MGRLDVCVGAPYFCGLKVGRELGGRGRGGGDGGENLGGCEKISNLHRI